MKFKIIQEVEEVQTPFFAALKSAKQTKKEPTKNEGMAYMKRPRYFAVGSFYANSKGSTWNLATSVAFHTLLIAASHRALPFV